MSLPTSIDNILNKNIVEDFRIEFKEGWDPEPIMHSICAFANDIDEVYGGYIFIGVKANDGVPVLPPKGIEKEKLDLVQQQVVCYCKKCLSPKYTPIISHETMQGRDIIVLWCFSGSERPYKCNSDAYSAKKDTKQEVYVRKGSSSLVATNEEINRIMESSRKVPFDDRPNYFASIDDLDKNSIRKFLKEAGSSLYDISANMPIEELMENLKGLSGPKESRHPTNAAVLMFSSHPDDYLPYSYIDYVFLPNPTGNGMTEKRFSGPLSTQFEDCINYIKNNVIASKTFKKKGQYQSKTVFNYPYEAVEEIIANALLHKSYDIHEPISVRVENDHLEVTSIPGFDRTIPEKAIKELNPRSKIYKNRRISDYLKELHIVEAKNTGYPTILQSVKENDSPLPYIDTNKERDYVTICLPINKKFLEESNTEETGKDGLESKILAVLENGPKKKMEIARELGYTRIYNSLNYQLLKLEKEGKVSSSGRLWKKHQ